MDIDVICEHSKIKVDVDFEQKRVILKIKDKVTNKTVVYHCQLEEAAAERGPNRVLYDFYKDVFKQ